MELSTTIVSLSDGLLRTCLMINLVFSIGTESSRTDPIGPTALPSLLNVRLNLARAFNIGSTLKTRRAPIGTTPIMHCSIATDFAAHWLFMTLTTLLLICTTLITVGPNLTYLTRLSDAHTENTVMTVADW